MEFLQLHDVALNTAPSYASLSRVQYWQEITEQASQSLISQLQTTLDLQQQLEIFSMAASKILPLNSVELHTAVGQFIASGSMAAEHEYRSVLVLNQQCLAELLYKSDYPFTPMIQREFLLLESEWLHSLKNALVVAHLQQMALKDTLTALGNRRFFDDSMKRTVQLAKRNQQSCALILLDLDNFKQVNDQYGHSAGDEVLLAVANCMRDTLRTTDSIFRLGGDEFAVLLAEKDASSAELIAHRLVKVINRNHLCQKYHVTVSAGLALLTEHEDESAFFGRADKALYAAKQAGKKTVSMG